MIQLTDLQKVIGENTTVDIPELIVAEGEIAALVGPAGSGKSLLLNLLTGRDRPTMGSVLLGGFDPYHQKERFGRHAGVLFAEDGLYNHISPLANLVFFCQLLGLPKSRAAEVLSLVGLADQADVKFKHLSSSLQRRLAFGRAILHGPKVLLLEEPFARCNKTTIALLASLMQAQSETGCAILILASDSTHLEPFCDVIYDLSQGRITARYASQDSNSARTPFIIPVRLEDKVILFNPAEILYADAGDGRAYIVTADNRFPTQFTLSELEQRLAPSGFFRAHRSYLVNLQHVKEVIPYTRNSFSLRLNDESGTKIPLSKSSASELKELLGF
jgi:ABC-2 type transport system ATP-binding protein